MTFQNSLETAGVTIPQHEFYEKFNIYFVELLNKNGSGYKVFLYLDLEIQNVQSAAAGSIILSIGKF